jgi:hypothetical protein
MSRDYFLLLKINRLLAEDAERGKTSSSFLSLFIPMPNAPFSRLSR